MITFDDRRIITFNKNDINVLAEALHCYVGGTNPDESDEKFRRMINRLCNIIQYNDLGFNKVLFKKKVYGDR